MLACAYLPVHSKVLGFDINPSSYSTTCQLRLLTLVKMNQQEEKEKEKNETKELQSRLLEITLQLCSLCSALFALLCSTGHS